MIIKGIEVENFRNIKRAGLEFCEGVNIFCGDNAQGKTNMLEALSVCLGKGMRRARTASLIPFGNDGSDSILTLYYEADTIPGKENTVRYKISGGKSSVEINGIPLKSASELYGELKHVVFAPEHLTLVKGASEVRRYYIDNIAVLQNKAHKRAVADYAAAVKQLAALNNEIIASPDTVQNTSDTISIWSDIMIRQGINLTYGRLKYFELLREASIRLYNELTLGKEELSLIYHSNIYGNIEGGSTQLDFTDKNTLYNTYVEKLNKFQVFGQRSDFRIRVGAHRDDIIFTLNGINAREFGSQGQVKSISLIMKLAEAEIIRGHNRETPVILLDEVLGELDALRRDYVVNRLGRSQVFITACDYRDFADSSEAVSVWNVADGEFSPACD